MKKNFWGTFFAPEAQKKVPNLFFSFFLGTQKILGGQSFVTERGAPTGNVTSLTPSPFVKRSNTIYVWS